MTRTKAQALFSYASACGMAGGAAIAAGFHGYPLPAIFFAVAGVIWLGSAIAIRHEIDGTCK